jgi:4'-phosphopantetheinyl transferase EntD
VTLANPARGLFPPGVVVAHCAIGRAEPLWPQEARAVASAVPARQAEFAAGRTAARQALVALGADVAAIPMGADRAPVWPEGVVGSITHAGGHALAAVARVADFAGLGLDIEPATTLAPDLVSDIAMAPEQAWLWGQPDPLMSAKQVFVAKEAAYKAQYALSRMILGFDALAVSFDAQGFTATFTGAVPPFGHGDHLSGRSVMAEGFILAAVAIVAP